uniref:Amyloid protein-binding protein 2 n=3 Tax=Pararge aegeria TaxID=116150 RepID=S4PXW1_9NEOP
MRALALLTPHTPPKIMIEVVRACGKACVVKRRFSAAGLLVRQGVALARAVFGPAHPRYAAALLDYGFYLLNIDSITHSVSVYEEALNTLRRVFGRSSLHVATAQEDLAYALYVLEYSSGRFYKARDHAERAIRIIENLVPPDHLLLASAKRVKALILEEIALDTPAGQDMREPSLLEESESLHKAALELSMMAFGEKNVQTAKHYGNLGRLYQSMQKFQDAETMHLKAIAIKEELLGSEDYEVGLSVGHLASLYNYHMNMHRAAEKLYLRSISISLKLFGERYSGLEYDYRGLVHVFTQLKRHDRALHYNSLLQHWHDLREQSKAEQQPALGDERIMPLKELQARFFCVNELGLSPYPPGRALAL